MFLQYILVNLLICLRVHLSEISLLVIVIKTAKIISRPKLIKFKEFLFFWNGLVEYSETSESSESQILVKYFPIFF